MSGYLEKLIEAAQLGGPVVMILVAMSVVTLTVVLFKLWQFHAVGVGRHKILSRAVAEWDAGQQHDARQMLMRSRSYLAPLVGRAFDAPDGADNRLRAEAEAQFSALERGFRLLDTVAQIAPLLGLFGTVLGMIEAFQALQQAGAQVDPSILAGGIWVVLLTTAVGLIVAMPASALLSWFEGRIEADRVLADHALMTVLVPQTAASGVSHAEAA